MPSKHQHLADKVSLDFPKGEGEYSTYATVTMGQAYFAVIVWWNPEMGGFWEPWDTGIGRFGDVESAAQEADELAKEYGIPRHKSQYEV